MQEFKQYGHYMQPRIHKMVQEVRLPELSARFCLALVSGSLQEAASGHAGQ